MGATVQCWPGSTFPQSSDQRASWSGDDKSVQSPFLPSCPIAAIWLVRSTLIHALNQAHQSTLQESRERQETAKEIKQMHTHSQSQKQKYSTLCKVYRLNTMIESLTEINVEGVQYNG